MSLDKNKRLEKLEKLDNLDNKLLNIIKIRTALVHKILKNKKSKIKLLIIKELI